MVCTGVQKISTNIYCSAVVSNVTTGQGVSFSPAAEEELSNAQVPKFEGAATQYSMNSLKVSHCDAQHQRPLAGVLRFPASSCISRTRCGLRQQQRAYQSQASHALEQQHEVNNRTSEQQEHHINPDEWDMNYWCAMLCCVLVVACVYNTCLLGVWVVG